jgi:hypothetical protein
MVKDYIVALCRVCLHRRLVSERLGLLSGLRSSAVRGKLRLLRVYDFCKPCTVSPTLGADKNTDRMRIRSTERSIEIPLPPSGLRPLSLTVACFADSARPHRQGAFSFCDRTQVSTSSDKNLCGDRGRIAWKSSIVRQNGTIRCKHDSHIGACPEALAHRHSDLAWSP